MRRPLRLLMIDDSETDVELVVVELRRNGYAVTVERVDAESSLRSALASGPWDVAVCDHRLPSFSSAEALRMVQETNTDLPFVILSGTIGEEAAVEALKAGARDVVLKANLPRIGLVVARQLAEAENRRRRRASEHALSVSEARKSAILDSALDAVITIDHDGKIIDFNPAAETMFGYQQTDVQGKPMAALSILPTLRRQHGEAFARHLATGQSRILGERRELSALRADGSEFPAELSITRGELFGQPFFTCYIRDVTDRKEAERERANLEEQLRQAQKMEAIGNLAGGVAHDFNNILTVIRGAAGIALNQLEDGTVRTKVEQIDTAAAHAAALTQQLLAFSRQQVLQPQPTDLNTVVEATLDLAERLIGQHVELTRDLDPDLHAVIVDPHQLQQVILNLCVNARDAMPAGGTLLIHTTNAVLDQAYASEHADVTPGAYSLLEITDSGTGMNEQTRNRIFDPFFTTKQMGTGLGLATVFGIVKQSGGHVEVYSEIGLGTNFKIYLPYAEHPVADPTAEPAHAALVEATETILLVEDNQMLRPLLTEVLEGYGYTVRPASDGAEAIAIAEEHNASIDLLLTDVIMPGLNGGELAQILAQKYPNLKVLFTSGYPAGTVVQHGITEARIAFIQKPFLADELARKIRATLDKDPNTNPKPPSDPEGGRISR